MLHDISKQALKNLKNYSYINKEQWKYTDLKIFKNIDFNGTAEISNKNNNYSNNKIKINNNQINKQFVCKDYVLDSIEEAINNNIKNCNKKFNKIIPKNINQFILSNTAFFKKGFFIHFNDNTILDKPLYISDTIKQLNCKSFFNNRYLFSFGKNVSLKIVIDDKTIKNNSLNTIYELFIDENSNIDFIFQSEKPKTTQILNFGSIIEKNSNLNIYPIHLSGKTIKNNFFIHLKEKNSKFNYNGINLLKEKNHIDNYIEINHQNKFTYSNTNQKNILNDKSISVFYSKAIIGKNCTNSEAYQKNNNIMLSPNANIYSNPQLEIYNNDVKCSHGSTTGALDNDSIFYLRSRGINLKDAKNILLNGFIKEMIEPININNFTKNIINKVNNWLANVN